MDTVGIITLADINARNVDDATLSAWLDHPIREVRSIALHERRRRTAERNRDAWHRQTRS